MALTRRAWMALGAGGATAVLMPALLLIPAGTPAASGAAKAAAPLAPPPPPAVANLYRRTLFGTAVDPAPPADAPELLGIAGRIDADAVAMVRTAGGETRSLRPGDSVDGWRLEALAADAASFARGTETVRVAVAGVAEGTTEPE